MNRATPSLKPPPDDPTELRSFPRQVVESSRPLFRVVRQGNLPWWFGSTMEGRFDLEVPHGTCYLALDVLSALLEVIGPGPATPAFVEARCIRRMFAPRTVEIANTRDRKASRFGVTAEIGTITPYELPQAWAARLHGAGAEGISYWLRHDPARAEGCALFSETGLQKTWNPGRERAISSSLLDQLRKDYGFEIIKPPRSNQLSFKS